MTACQLVDKLEDVKNRLRFVQDLLCVTRTGEELSLSSEGVSGLYMIIEEAETLLMEAREALINT